MMSSTAPAPSRNSEVVAEHLKHLGLVHSALLVVVAVVLALCFAARDVGTDLVLEAHMLGDLWTVAGQRPLDVFELDPDIREQWRRKLSENFRSNRDLTRAKVFVDDRVGGVPILAFDSLASDQLKTLELMRFALRDTPVRVAMFSGRQNRELVTALTNISRTAVGDYQGFRVIGARLPASTGDSVCANGLSQVQIDGEVIVQTPEGEAYGRRTISALAPIECTTLLVNMDFARRFPSIDAYWSTFRFATQHQLLERARLSVQKAIDSASPATTVLGVAMRPAHVGVIGPALIVAIQLYLLAFLVDLARLPGVHGGGLPTVWIGALRALPGRIAAYSTLAVLPSVTAGMASYLFISQPAICLPIFAGSLGIGAATYRLSKFLRG